MQGIRDGGVLTCNFEDVEGVLLSNNLVYLLLAFSSKDAIIDVVAYETLVSPGVQAVENRHLEAREAVHVHLVRGEPRGGTEHCCM